MKLIEHIHEPTKINIIWQQPSSDGRPSGDRYLVGEIRLVKGVFDKQALKYYDTDEVKKAIEAGFTGLTAFPYKDSFEYTGNIIETLSKRLPPKTRGDFVEYLQSFGLSEKLKDSITMAELLAYTNGRVSGDGFSFFHSFDNVEIPFEFSFEIAGFRHNDGMKIEDIKSLLGKAIALEPEKTNQHDQEAIKVVTEYAGKRIMLGYIPKGLNCVVHKYIKTNNSQSWIAKVNGSPERPSVLVITRVG